MKEILKQVKIFNATHPLTNFETQKFYQNEPKFNAAYSRNSLSKIKDRTYVINLDEYKSVGTHWIALYVNVDNKHVLIAWELNKFQKDSRAHTQEKYYDKYL